MNAIKIEQFRPEYPAYFVYTTKVVELWRPDCLFVSKWDGESRTSWFRWPRLRGPSFLSFLASKLLPWSSCRVFF